MNVIEMLSFLSKLQYDIADKSLLCALQGQIYNLLA